MLFINVLKESTLFRGKIFCNLSCAVTVFFSPNTTKKLSLSLQSFYLNETTLGGDHNDYYITKEIHKRNHITQNYFFISCKQLAIYCCVKQFKFLDLFVLTGLNLYPLEPTVISICHRYRAMSASTFVLYTVG